MEPGTLIREDWHFEVVACLQRSVGDLSGLDAHVFGAACDRLASELPPPETLAERLHLTMLLRSFTMSAASDFHRRFHRAVTGVACSGAPAEAIDRLWSMDGPDADPRTRLSPWATRYLAALAQEHPWPPEMLAASIVRRHYWEMEDLRSLARATATSRPVLVRRFAERYGIPVGRYRALIRAREAVRRLRHTPWTVDAIARDVGYASTKNLYAALDEFTALTPDVIRSVDAAHLQSLFEPIAADDWVPPLGHGAGPPPRALSVSGDVRLVRDPRSGRTGDHTGRGTVTSSRRGFQVRIARAPPSAAVHGFLRLRDLRSRSDHLGKSRPVEVLK